MTDAQIERRIAEEFAAGGGVPAKLFYTFNAATISDADRESASAALGANCISVQESRRTRGEYRLVAVNARLAPASFTLASGFICRITQAGGRGEKVLEF